MIFPPVEAAEMLKESPDVNDGKSVDAAETEEPKKKKKKQKVGFRDRKV